MLANQILIERRLIESWEQEMKKIPDRYKIDLIGEDGQQYVYRWKAVLKNWEYNNDANKVGGKFKKDSWTMMQPRPATDENGKPLKDPKTGKPIMTRYHDQWRYVTKAAVNQIDAGVDGGGKRVVEPDPIKDRKTVKFGQKGKERTYIYSDMEKTWYDNTTKKPVNRTSELHSFLMAQEGFEADGTTPLGDKTLKALTKLVLKSLGLNKYAPDGRLGAASQQLARTWAGRRGGELGDLIGRGIVKLFGLDKQADLKMADKKDKETKRKEAEKDIEELEITPTDNDQQLLKDFELSVKENPDIVAGAVVSHPKDPTQSWRWNGKAQWRSIKTGRIHTVNPKVKADIVKFVTPEDLEKLNKGESININGKPATPGEQFHAELYAVYHQKYQRELDYTGSNADNLDPNSSEVNKPDKPDNTETPLPNVPPQIMKTAQDIVGGAPMVTRVIDQTVNRLIKDGKQEDAIMLVKACFEIAKRNNQGDPDEKTRIKALDELSDLYIERIISGKFKPY